MFTVRISSVFSALALAAALAACAVDVGGGVDEDAPIDTRDNEAEQGLYDCSERQDTGYTNGNAFAITVVTVDGKPLEVQTANAYVVMQEAAAADGVGIRVVSGFRTMSEQEYLYGCYVNCNCNSCNLAASPGHSNHQSGHALDLNTSDGGVLDWLNAHGAAFGFARTVPSEAWHWEWWGGGPGGGPCGADQECLDNHNFGGCDGTVITNCDDNNHVGSGDCGAFGAGCSTEGGAPHCVHPLCMIHLNGGEDGTFCTDQTKIGTCALGVYSEGDCGAFGGQCGMEGGTAHCVHFMCWSHLDGAEDGSFCGDDGVTLGTCAVGAYSESSCADGCVDDDGPTAHCAGEAPPPPPPDPTPGDAPPGDGTEDGPPPKDTGDGDGGGEDEGGAITTAHAQQLPSSVTHGCSASGEAAAPLMAAAALLATMRRARKRHRGK